jgi:predicted Zn-dependent protease with MMP-like domain
MRVLRVYPCGVNRADVEALVAEELDRLPRQFADRLGSVQVIVEDAPSPELLESLGLDPEEDTLFGLYDGVPLPERGWSDSGLLPDRISIYSEPLLEACSTRRSLRREIRTTLIHEIAHYLGMDDDVIDDLGYA